MTIQRHAISALFLILSGAAFTLPAAAQSSGRLDGQAVTSSYATSSGAESSPGELDLPASCRIGDTVTAKGTWLESRSVTVRGAEPRAISFNFDQPTAAGAWRASLNRNALRALDKVEVQDAQGGWTLAWSGKLPGAPDAACPGAWFASNLQGKHKVHGLRFSFRSSEGSVNVTHVGLLKG